MKLSDAADYLYDKAVEKGLKVFDIVGGISESTGLEIFESKVQNTEISYGSGIGIRIFREGRPGISFTEKLSSQSLIQTLEDAISNSEITDSMELELPEKQTIHEFDLKIYDPGVNEVSFENMIHLGLELEKIAKLKDIRVENVPYLGVSKSESFSVFRNSKGVAFDRKSNSASAYVGVTASQGEQKKWVFIPIPISHFQNLILNLWQGRLSPVPLNSWVPVQSREVCTLLYLATAYHLQSLVCSYLPTLQM